MLLFLSYFSTKIKGLGCAKLELYKIQGLLYPEFHYEIKTALKDLLK